MELRSADLATSSSICWAILLTKPRVFAHCFVLSNSVNLSLPYENILESNVNRSMTDVRPPLLEVQTSDVALPQTRLRWTYLHEHLSVTQCWFPWRQLIETTLLHRVLYFQLAFTKLTQRTTVLRAGVPVTPLAVPCFPHPCPDTATWCTWTTCFSHGNDENSWPKQLMEDGFSWLMVWGQTPS